MPRGRWPLNARVSMAWSFQLSQMEGQLASIPLVLEIGRRSTAGLRGEQVTPVAAALEYAAHSISGQDIFFFVSGSSGDLSFVEGSAEELCVVGVEWKSVSGYSGWIK